jgi:hypothetical protein
MSAPPKLCGFDLLPPRDFHLMVSWVPPGITSRFTAAGKEPAPQISGDAPIAYGVDAAFKDVRGTTTIGANSVGLP